MTIALVTNVTQYAGPGAAQALAADGFTVLCHDATFADEEGRARFASVFPHLVALAAQEPAALVREAGTHALAHGAVEVLISNDYVPAATAFASLEDSTLASYEIIIRALLFTPFQLIQAVVPAMKQARSGRIILITSAAAERPLPQALMYSTARAAATSLATVTAKAVAEHNIQVNSIGPNWFENPTYFPAGQWEKDADLRRRVEQEVPMKRLGQQHEMGALISFLASGKSLPVTGQFFGFAGGWLP